MAGSAELRGGSPHHGIVGEAEQGEGQENSHHDIESWLEESSHGSPRYLEKTLLLRDYVAIVYKDELDQEHSRKV